jgi:hypothetical protein
VASSASSRGGKNSMEKRVPSPCKRSTTDVMPEFYRVAARTLGISSQGLERGYW